MTVVNKERVFDIFNIPRDGSNVQDDDNDDMGVGGDKADVSFSIKAKEVADNVSRIEPGINLKSKEEMPKQTKKTETKVEVKQEEKLSPVEQSSEVIPSQKSDLFGDIFDSEEPVKNEEKTEKMAGITKESKPAITKEIVDAEQQEESVEQDKKANTQSAPMSDLKTVENAYIEPKEGREDPLPIEGSYPWMLKAPHEKYERLYEEKRRLLSSDLLKGGEIPFDEFYEELHQSSVDVNVPTFDTEEVGKRITEVQKHRDRVKFMQLRVNAQYFVWKEFMDLLPGILARIEYERGKQEGLVYEHLRDFKNYFGNLEGLHKSCESVCKHLDGAYASLSRQIAIAQPLQEVERYSPSSGSKPITQQQKRYDSLQTNANVGSKTNNLKSAVGTAESQQDGWESLL